MMSAIPTDAMAAMLNLESKAEEQAGTTSEDPSSTARGTDVAREKTVKSDAREPAHRPQTESADSLLSI